jgi:hypothetical protein
MTPQQITDATDLDLRYKIEQCNLVIDAYERLPTKANERLILAADKIREACQDELDQRAEAKEQHGTDVQSVSNV